MLKRKFAEICDPRGNVIMERHKFNTRIQKEGESFQSFVADLRILANTCEYGILKDELIRDKIVCGVSSRHIQKQLLKERDLTLDRAIDIGIANELSDKNNTELSSNQVSDPKEEVHGLDRGGSSKKDSTRLHSSQERRAKSTAQWKLTANKLKLKLTLALNVM